MKTIAFTAILFMGLIISTASLTNQFVLSFYAAARLKTQTVVAAYLSNSVANVVWNDQIVLSIVPSDYELHFHSVVV